MQGKTNKAPKHGKASDICMPRQGKAYQCKAPRQGNAPEQIKARHVVKARPAGRQVTIAKQGT
jgi:hypothetical protein